MSLSELIGKLIAIAISEGDLEVQVNGEFDERSDNGDRIKDVDTTYGDNKRVRLLV